MISFVIIVILIILVLIYIYNMFIQLKNNIKNSKSLIDVYLQKRFDLIPNLLEITKGYAKHEEELLQNIAILRNSYKENKDEKSMQQLNSEFSTLLGIIEAHPELKSSGLFLKMQKSLKKIESELEAARRIYNLDVTKYNTKIHIFPLNILAKTFKFTDENLFTFKD